MDKDVKEKLREDWKKVEQNAETIYFNEEQANSIINAIEKGKDTEVRYIDVISKIERGTEKLKELLDKKGNVKRDSEGRILLSKDDEWREEIEWDELIKAVNEDNPDNEDRYCTVEESLRESLKQMKLMREGKIPKRTWDDYRKAMDKTTKKYSKALSNLADNDYKKDTAWNDFYNECELDIISTIFDNDDEENMNEQDIKRLIEEEKIYRGMRDREYFDKNFLYDDDEDLQEVYKEMLDCNDSEKS